jgi:hypothetical protein
MERPQEPDCTIKTSDDDPCHQDELLDEAIAETFPASDPVSITIEKPGGDQRGSGK